MAFEIIDPPPSFASLSPARRLLAVLLGVAALFALLWCCDVAYHAQSFAPARQNATRG
jgi:hypothetical protein